MDSRNGACQDNKQVLSFASFRPAIPTSAVPATDYSNLGRREISASSYFLHESDRRGLSPQFGRLCSASSMTTMRSHVQTNYGWSLKFNHHFGCPLDEAFLQGWSDICCSDLITVVSPSETSLRFEDSFHSREARHCRRRWLLALSEVVITQPDREVTIIICADVSESTTMLLGAQFVVGLIT
jgi:hypothetical protein